MAETKGVNYSEAQVAVLVAGYQARQDRSVGDREAVQGRRVQGQGQGSWQARDAEG